MSIRSDSASASGSDLAKTFRSGSTTLIERILPKLGGHEVTE
jgi:hypothetical protein